MANPVAHVGTRPGLVRHIVALAGAGELGALGVTVRIATEIRIGEQTTPNRNPAPRF